MKKASKKLLVLFLISVLMISAVGCATDTAPEDPTTTEAATVAFICADMGNPSQAYATSQFEALAGDYNLEVIVMNSEGDSQLETANVQSAIAQGVKALYVNPNDINSILPALQEAKDAGIIVGMFSSDVPEGNEALRDFFVGVDDLQAGVEAANAFIAAFPDGANIVEVGGQSGHDAQIKRHGAFTPVISASNVKVLDVQACDQWSTDQALAIMEDFIVKYGDEIQGVFCHWDGGLTGVIQALDAAGMDTKGMFLVGIDGSKSGVDQVIAGTQDLTIGQDFKEMSRKSLELTRDVLDGKTVEVKNFIPLMLVTAENIDTFTFPEW
jgi:ribose transport system substrate-binding protein